jgi:hypothetical protein
MLLLLHNHPPAANNLSRALLVVQGLDHFQIEHGAVCH